MASIKKTTKKTTQRVKVRVVGVCEDCRKYMSTGKKKKKK